MNLLLILINLIIIKIDVEGDEPELIKSVLNIEEGDEFSPEALYMGVKRLYSMGVWRDISVDTSIIKDGVEIKINVEKNPKVSKIYFSGNKKIKTRKLRELVKDKENFYIQPSFVFDIKNKIKEMYKKKGYVLIDIEDYLEQDTIPGMFKLIFKIKEGKKVVIRKIKFEGNKHIKSSTLKRKMKNKEKRWYNSGIFKDKEFRKDLSRIERYYREKGYIDAEVEDYKLDYREDGLYILIKVKEGRRYRVGRISFEGNEVFSDEELERYLKLKEGKVYNLKKAEKTIQKIQEVYADLGYIYMRIFPDETLRNDTVVDIKYKITEGVRAKVRRIEIVGNDHTYDKVIRREIYIFPGDYFNRSLVIRSQQNIYNLGFFEDVKLEIKQIDEGVIDLVFRVKEKLSAQIGAGVSFSERDGLTGYVELSQPNLFGKGQKVYLKLEKGGKKEEANIRFLEPWLFDTPTSLGAQIYYRTVPYMEYDKEELGAGINSSRPIFLDYTRLYLSMDVERGRVKNISSSYTPSPPYDIREDTVPKITFSNTISIRRDSRDYIFNAFEGSYTMYQFKFAWGPYIGDIGYQKHIVEFRWHIPLFWKFSVMFRERFGYIRGNTSPDDIPLYERFRPGGVANYGEDQVRGYPDWSLGPKSGGVTVGGRAMFIQNVELKLRLHRSFSIITFYDAGNAWNTPAELNFNDLKRGVGAGVIVEVPMIGIISFSMGYGIDGGKWQPHFLIGKAF